MADPDGTRPIRVGSWYQGPTGTGQGGWTAHRFAERIREPVTVALRAPIPLDTDLTIVETGDEHDRGWELVTGDRAPIMLAARWDPSFPETEPVAIDEANAARARFGATVPEHPVPYCFSCGLQRDSMRVHAGPLGDDRFATDWTVPDWAVRPGGGVDEGALWAALDCCAAWWVGYSRDARTALTVQYAVEVLAPLEPAADYSLVAWAGDDDAEWDGRKRRAASAAFAADGTCVARSVSLWVSVRHH